MQDDGARLGNNQAIMRMMMVSLPGWACCWLGLAAEVMIYSQVQACARRDVNDIFTVSYLQGVLLVDSLAPDSPMTATSFHCCAHYCCLLGAAVQCCQLQGALRRNLWGGPLEC